MLQALELGPLTAVGAEQGLAQTKNPKAPGMLRFREEP